MERSEIFDLLEATREARRKIGGMPRQVQAGLLLRSSLNNLTKVVQVHDAIMESLNVFSDYRSVRDAHQSQMDEERREKAELREALSKAFEKKDWGDASPHNFLNHVFKHGEDAAKAAAQSRFEIDPR